MSQIQKNEIKKQYEANYQIRKDIATFIFNYRGDIKDRAKWIDYLGIKVSFAEMQGGIDSVPPEGLTNTIITDSNKPKFKVGDWIVDNCGYVWKIEGILNQFYLGESRPAQFYLLEGVEGGESRPTIGWVNKTFHLWNISDVKDGDVLVDKYNNIGIFMNTKDNWYSYIYLRYNDELRAPVWNALHEQIDVHPATKEQRDIFFAKMKEEGYKWDAEKKELKQIKQKHTKLSEYMKRK